MVDFRLSEEEQAAREQARAFVEEHVIPAEGEAFEIEEATGEFPWRVVDRLRKQARSEGLWVPHMPEAWGGMGLDAIGLGLVHEELGASPLGPISVNGMAPDEGNMHALLHFGSEAQKETWLGRLVEAEIRSCFAMTEPHAGADPYAIQTSAEKDGDEWVINGRKWFVSGADGADVSIIVAVNDPDVHPKKGTSLFLTPTDAPGFEVVRQIESMGTHLPGGHCELAFDDLRIPEENVLGGLGMGYMVAQHRLALGRTTHAMRWIGTAQRALDMAASRARERESFGKQLGEHQAVQWMLADSARELYLSRMMVLRCAWMIQEGLDPRHEVSLLKVFAANALQDIVDRAIQIHGALGYSKDLPLERFFRDARAARIYDGPDEVHQWSIARRVLKTSEEKGTTREAAGSNPEGIE